MKLYSPAKLNLFFRVLEKRTDGFHEIASLMQAISLCDTLYFKISRKDTLTCTDPTLSVEEDNFISRARAFFRKKTGFTSPISIHLEKKIPMEGGLGGGSGNIATTLWALNELSELSIEDKTLRIWAGELSSDAPFFFSSGTAYTTGRGEEVRSLDPLKKISLYLAKPKGGLSTPLVYQHCTPNAVPPKELLEKALRGNITPLSDLEVPAFFLRPDLMKLKENLLRLGFDSVTMTGSGTAFFCFGKVNNPLLPEVQFTAVEFISRQEGSWYHPM